MGTEETGTRWTEGIWEFFEDGENGDILVRIRDGQPLPSVTEIYFGNAEGSPGVDYWNAWLAAHAPAMYSVLRAILPTDPGAEPWGGIAQRALLLLNEIESGPFAFLEGGETPDTEGLHGI